MALAVVALAAVVGWPVARAQGPAGLAQGLPSVASAKEGLFQELEWRNIGPHRASRTKALDGVPGQPHTFYIGASTDGTRAYHPGWHES